MRQMKDLVAIVTVPRLLLEVGYVLQPEELDGVLGRSVFGSPNPGPISTALRPWRRWAKPAVRTGYEHAFCGCSPTGSGSPRPVRRRHDGSSPTVRYIARMPSKEIAPDTDYLAFLANLKARIARARLSAARAVNRELLYLYWDIGLAIKEKQSAHGWGDAVVENLARDLLEAYPGNTGFSASNLWRMRQAIDVYTAPDFLAQLVREPGARREPGAVTLSSPEALAQAVRDLVVDVPWGHHVNVLVTIEDPAARLYYVRASARFGWSRAVLLNQVKSQAYERTHSEGKSNNFPAALPEHLAEQAEEALKSSYNLEFLGLGQAVLERDLEARLI